MSERYIKQGHIRWRYWIERQLNGKGDVRYAVYREWPQTIPPELITHFLTEKAAVEYLTDLWSDE